MTDVGYTRAAEDLSLVYDGPGLADGTMDVRDLAPALLGLSVLFQEANRIVNPTADDVSVKIEATSQSSFHIDLNLVAGAAVVLSSNPVTALANLKAIVIDPVVGVISYLVRKHREPEAIEAPPLENGDVEVIYPDGAQVRYPAAVMRVSRSTTVRRELTAVLRPLETGDCDEVVFTSSTTDAISITQDDLPAFAEDLGPDDPIEETDVLMTVSVIAPSFDGKKWRVSDGANTFWVSLRDADFEERIARNEVLFGDGDYLRCIVRWRQFEADTKAGLRLERDIIQVLDHRHRPAPPPQLDLGD